MPGVFLLSFLVKESNKEKARYKVLLFFTSHFAARKKTPPSSSNSFSCYAAFNSKTAKTLSGAVLLRRVISNWRFEGVLRQ